MEYKTLLDKQSKNIMKFKLPPDIYSLNLFLTYYSLLVLTVGIFLWPKILFLNHFFLYFPCFYFTYKAFQKNGITEFNEWKRSQLSLFGFSITAIFSILVNWSIMDEPIKNLLRIKHFIIPILGYYAYKEAFRSYIDFKKKKILLNLFFASVSFSTLYGLLAQLLGYNPISIEYAFNKGRASGMIDLLHYAYGISLVMILLTGLFFYRDKVKEYISTKWIIFHWIINFIGLYSTYTRGSWIGFFLPLPLFFIQRSKRFFIASIIISILSLLTFINIDKNANDRFLKSRESDGQRITFFKTAIYAFLEKPILGWGYRNFEFKVIDLKKKYDLNYKWQKGSAHNNFLEHLASTGILGFLFLVLFHLFWATEALSLRSYIGNISFVFLASFLVTGMVYYTLILGPNIVLIMTVYSIFITALPEKKLGYNDIHLDKLSLIEGTKIK